MSIKEVTYYQLVCDWPDCDETAHEGSDYSAWSEAESARNDADYGNGHCGTRWESDGEWYCDSHPVVWASDLAEAPEKPYLLIHDGDTNNSDDDGKVSLIRPVTEVLLDEGNVPLPEVCS